MDMSMHESRASSLRREIEKQGAKQASELKKAGGADEAAARKEKSAQSTTSMSLRKSRSREAAGKRNEATKARQRAGTAAEAMADAQAKLHEVEGNIRAEQSRDEKRRREKAERDQRQGDAERQRRERQRDREDRARDRELQALHSQVADQESRLREAALASAPEEITVLFIAASPEDQEPLRLTREVREIQRRVRESEHRESVRFEFRLATQLTDLLQALNEVRPHVVHFSGHGNQEALAFEDDDGGTKLLTNSDLAMLLRTASDRIRLAVFNTCQSAEQAERATIHLDAAIGMDESVADEAAKVFSGQFYNALGFGLSLAQAFEQARAQVKLATGSKSGEPRLHLAPGIAAEEVYLVALPRAEAA